MATMHVRLKPLNPRSGHVMQRFTAHGIRFEESKGWYKVDGRVAEYLKEVHAVPEDDMTPLAFDVCTEEQAKAMNKAEFERKVHSGKASPTEAHATFDSRDVSAPGGKKADLTTDDLKAGTSRASKRPPAAPQGKAPGARG